MAYNPPIGSIYHLYTTYILPSGGLYATYHLLGEPETTIETFGLPLKGRNHRHLSGDLLRFDGCQCDTSHLWNEGVGMFVSQLNTRSW